MIITCAQIQVAGKVVERSSHKARLTELNTSDETFPKDDHHEHVVEQMVEQIDWRKLTPQRSSPKARMTELTMSDELQLERNVFCILCSTREMCRIDCGHHGNFLSRVSGR